MDFTPNTSIGYQVNHLARLFSNALQRRIKPLGLSIGVFPIMVQLWERDGITQKELLELVGIEQATMTNTLNRMERDGLIIRRKGTSDARQRKIVLTERGISLREPAIKAALDQNKELAAGLSGDEQYQLLHLITKASEALCSKTGLATNGHNAGLNTGSS